MEKVIILFNSTHDAIRAERACLHRGLQCQAVPAPRDVSAECGIALEVIKVDRTTAEKIFEKEKISAIFHDR